MRIGIDLGGTKIEAIALDEVGGELARLRRSTPAADYEATLIVVADLVGELESQLGAASSVGVGTPGAIDPVTELLKNSNSVALNGQPLDVDLAAALGRPIEMANDADCFAVSEAQDGAAADADPVFGVILGTGVGGGIVANGALLRGPNAIAGEWGHNPLPWMTPEEAPGPACYCGKNGCIETFLSGGGLAADHEERGGGTLSGSQVAAAAHGGDPVATETMDVYHDRLARSLASVINVVDPEVVVLGGGVSNIDSLYAAVPALLANYVFGGTVLTRIVRAAHGDSSGVRGAAWL